MAGATATLWRWLWLPLALHLVGCRSAEREEATVMLRALEMMQAAPPPARAELLDALEEEPAQGAAAERARSLCVKAYRALTAATAAAAALPDGGLPKALDEDARTLLHSLQRADEQLKEAQQLLPRCHRATAALRQVAR